MKKLSIVIVNYNVCYFLDQALKSVQLATKNIDAEVFVVDNNSVDGSVQMVRDKFPEVILIDNHDNRGFSKANNQAIKQATGEYILLLNPDTVLETDTLEKCVEFMDDHPDAGGLGVKMLDGKGTFLPESKRGLPTPWIAFYKIFGFAKFFPKSKKFGRYHLGYLDDNETNEVDVLAGAFMMIRKTVMDKIGGLDEDYFMYGEDIDLSYCITKLGYKNYYFPEARIIHYKGESTKRTSINYVFVFYKAMIIFAKKHFNNKSAGWFSVLINFAIYLKAGMEIAKRFMKSIALPFLDALIIFGGMLFLKNYWELNHKYVANYYPWEFMGIAVPIYIIIWLLSIKFSGGYDKPTRSSNIFKGVIVGTILISAFSNFLSAHRYSRALILLGGGWAYFSMTISRLLFHFVKYKNFQLGSDTTKRVAVVGSETESERVIGLIKNSLLDINTVGYVSISPQKDRSDKYLGDISQVDEIVNIYRINEIVFCSKDIPASEIIDYMVEMNATDIDFKIVPQESDYVIGSSSNLDQGDFYTVNIEMNLKKQSSLRNKRVLDVVSALTLLCLSPIMMWLTHKPLKFIMNCLAVLTGKNTWVGFSQTPNRTLPKIKKGIISTSTHMDIQSFDSKTSLRLDNLYARDYQISFDVNAMLKSFKHLGD